MFYKKGIPKILWHRCFPVNFAKSFKNTFLQNTCGRRFLQSPPPHPPHTHIVCLTIWYHLFLEFSLVVDTWFFAHWRNQRAVTCLENVNQLNIRRGKKQGFQLSHRQPPTDSYNPNPYPLRWVFSRGIFPETFAPWATASANWLWLWNFPILFSWN